MEFSQLSGCLRWEAHCNRVAIRGAGPPFIFTESCSVWFLMAMCDARYTFTMVDIGGYDRDNDATIFNESAFGQAFKNSTVPIPNPKKKGEFTLPYVIMGDDIFPLKPWLIKPYSDRDLADEHRVFDYRLSTRRRTIENVFGILAARWRVYRRPIKGGVELVTNIAKATSCLHNYLKLKDNSFYAEPGFVKLFQGIGIKLLRLLMEP